MDDIAGLNWTSTPANGHKPATSNYSAFSALKPTPPASGRASPLNVTTSQPPSKSTTPANDSFANLVPFSAGPNKNLSLLEQQKRLAEAKLRQQQIQNQSIEDQYAAGDDQFWDKLGSGNAAPAVGGPKGGISAGKNNVLDDDDADLFAAFNKPSPARVVPAVDSSAKEKAISVEDDDPFGLSDIAPRRTHNAATIGTIEEDDVLGLLGKPVSARSICHSPPASAKTAKPALHPQDKAVAELVDMGFPVHKARLALEATESGTDVQAAVGFLLNQAHDESRQKARPRDSTRQGGNAEGMQGEDHGESRDRIRFGEEGGRGNRLQHSALAPDKDFEQMASDLRSNFLKTAGSLWKQGTKRVQQAVQEFNSDGEVDSQPRWMRETERTNRLEQRHRQREQESGVDPERRRSIEASTTPSATNEALMLESSRPTPPLRQSVPSRPDRRVDPSPDNSRDHSPAIPSRLRDSIPQQQPASSRPFFPEASSSRSSLTKAAAEEQAARAYVSSARRRKPQLASQVIVSASEPDLLEGGYKDTAATAATFPSSSFRSQSQPVRQAKPAVRPAAPTRTIPSISNISLKACHSHREKGNEHFKLGDYSSAHQSYSKSISQLPDNHPLVIVLLTNRALTALKTGEPKSAIADADKAISVIGASRGESEKIDYGTGDAPKPMREYYGKALMRKAEALEQMEKWTDAASVWREAVEGGHGGATSIQGRLRAEKAAAPQLPKARPPVAARKPTHGATPVSSARRSAPPSSTGTAAAVTRLRAANLAAEKADDEKFRLADAVDARIQAWKGGKADNLRALLGSLDSALWEGSGWKKISMADLVLPGKVKVQYMKGIAKVHPDKVCFMCPLMAPAA